MIEAYNTHHLFFLLLLNHEFPFFVFRIHVQFVFSIPVYVFAKGVLLFELYAFIILTSTLVLYMPWGPSSLVCSSLYRGWVHFVKYF